MSSTLQGHVAWDDWINASGLALFEFSFHSLVDWFNWCESCNRVFTVKLVLSAAILVGFHESVRSVHHVRAQRWRGASPIGSSQKQDKLDAVLKTTRVCCHSVSQPHPVET